MKSDYRLEMRNLLRTIVLIFIVLNGFAQERKFTKGQIPQGSGSISGIVLDAATIQPVEYANIVIYRMRDSSMVTGTVTDQEGKFLLEEVPWGFYQIKVDFIGYEQKLITKVPVIPRKPNVDLGEIKIKQASMNLREIEVVADKSAYVYKIDKKVVNVSQDLSSASGTAADVLENTPSIEVDIEGNVKLRGSSNFTVLINGRPSVLSGSDALQQISASQIDNIEIITNPSAKYDPEGTAGIINVIMKQQKEKGFTGLFNAGIGTKGKYNADFLLNYKFGDINIYAGMDYRNDNFHMDRKTDRETYSNDTTYFYQSEDARIIHRGGLSGKLGLDWYLNKKTTLGLSGKYGFFKFSFEGNGKNKEWLNPGDSSLYYISQGIMTRPREYYNINFNLTHNFNDKGHKIIGIFYWADRWGDSEDETLEWETDEDWNRFPDPMTSIKTSEDEKSNDIRIQLDYTKPFSEISQLEAGFQSRIENETEDYDFQNYVPGTGWVDDSSFSSVMDYNRNIHAAYVTWQDELFGIGYQFGLRGEYTDRSISDQAIDTTYTIDRIDYFPSVHLSKELPNKNQIIASYSRRINRPRGRYLDPFKIYIDANNLRQGNPSLEPEYVDSYELGWLKKWNSSFLSVEGYYRLKTNSFTRIFKSYEGNVIIHTIENLNKEYSAGIDIMLNQNIGKKVLLNLNGDLYYYKLEGELETGTVNKENFSWRSRLMTTYKFLPSSRVQFMLGYRGPRKTAQGETEGMLMTNLALRHDFLKRKATVTLQIRDLFGTMKRDFTSSSDTFWEHTVMARESPIVNLTFRYRLNNYQQERERTQEDDRGNMEMDYGY